MGFGFVGRWLFKQIEKSRNDIQDLNTKLIEEIVPLLNKVNDNNKDLAILIKQLITTIQTKGLKL